MTASKKVLLAALIVSAGYGLAALLGAPKIVPLAGLPLGGAVQNKPVAATPSVESDPAADGQWALGAPRLIPDRQLEQSAEYPESVAPLASMAEPSSRTSFNHASPAPQPAADTAHSAPTSQPALTSRRGPRGRLRNEAPRPLGNQAPPPVVAKTVEPSAAPNVEQGQTIQLLSAPGATPANSKGAPLTGNRLPPPAAAASFDTALGTHTANDMVVPPPFEPSDEMPEPRRHIIIDGDSLARLAGRYLNDPHRGDEIFELNRHLLSDPELLPIGTEIDIPPRSSTVTSSGPSSSRGAATHAASRAGLVPVRPAPAGASVMPRAQLSVPLPVE